VAAKGERTRARVLDEAARTFNSRGYAATPISALLAETGLEKGGLYHHFAGGKAQLELAAFGHAVALVEQRLLVDPAQSGLVRLRGFL
jgi:AcrR family transcriptional regulator